MSISEVPGGKPMGIKNIGIIANIYKDQAIETARVLKGWIEERGLNVYLEKDIAERLASGQEQGRLPGYDMDSLAERCDMIVVFGGDGTLLMAARYLRKYEVPLLGVNLGGFGYLTVVNLSEMCSDIEKIIQGDYRIEKRMMLDIFIFRGGKPIEEHSVLNDAVVSRGNLRRLVEIETRVDDQYLTTYKADGLIISTPTGSTAYSLSAGGPIIFPQLDSMILNPICSHPLTTRPVILPGWSVVSLFARMRERGATLTLDGQVSLTLEQGDRIGIKRSVYRASLIDSPHRDYLEILRTKLGWGGLPGAVPS